MSRRPTGSGGPRPNLPQRSLAAILAVAGVLLIVLGWYGVSGTATVAEQLPYFASGTIPGAALLVASAVVLAGAWSSPRGADRLAELVDDLRAALLEVGEQDDAPAANAPAVADPASLVAVGAGAHYHRPACPLVAGKDDVRVVDAAAIAAGGLAPCRVCEPDPVGGERS